MIIVSQDGEAIVNFKRVNVININQLNKKEIDAYFNCNENQEDSLFLGEYATEERAKEVLTKIMQCYTNTEQYKCFSNNSDKNYETLNYLIKNSFIYEMPKE